MLLLDKISFIEPNDTIRRPPTSARRAAMQPHRLSIATSVKHLLRHTGLQATHATRIAIANRVQRTNLRWRKEHGMRKTHQEMT
jgi:hypothetical protein